MLWPSLPATMYSLGTPRVRSATPKRLRVDAPGRSARELELVRVARFTRWVRDAGFRVISWIWTPKLVFGVRAPSSSSLSRSYAVAWLPPK